LTWDHAAGASSTLPGASRRIDEIAAAEGRKGQSRENGYFLTVFLSRRQACHRDALQLARYNFSNGRSATPP